MKMQIRKKERFPKRGDLQMLLLGRVAKCQSLYTKQIFPLKILPHEKRVKRNKFSTYNV